MRARILALREALTSSYWFVPTLMAIGATLLAIGITVLEERLGPAWLYDFSWLRKSRPEGARVLLGAIAGSMVTVAGVVFSITLAAVTYASGQFGPRLLTNFMRDRANQVVLGTFTATFLYCLLVLRTIRSADEPGNAFVPHIGVFVAVLLAVASIGVLIFFVHHVPRSVHASHVAARIGGELRASLETLFPERIGTGGPSDVPVPMAPDAVGIEAPATGYVQGVDAQALLNAAQAHDLTVFAPVGPGEFLIADTPYLAAHPPENVTDEARAALQAAVTVGPERTPEQDALFLVDELVEIAARALSPGVNDPATAITCFDWLLASASFLTHRENPSPLRYDDAQRLRVVTRPVTFERFVAHAFSAARPYVAHDRNAALHLLNGLARLAVDAVRDADRDLLRAVAGALHAEAREALTHDRPALDAALRAVGRMLDAPSLEAHLTLRRRTG